MAAACRRVRLALFLSRLSSLALAWAALLILDTADDKDKLHKAYRLLRWALRSLVMPLGWAVLCFQGLCLGGVLPLHDVLLAVVVVLEWVLMCVAAGAGCAALAVAHTAMGRRGAGAVCAKYLAAASILACAAGALAAVSALRMLWMLGSRFRRAQA